MNVPKIAILAPVPEYEEDWSHIKADYTRLLGDQATFIDWTKAGDLSGFDLVTPLLAWGYPRDCPRWFALLDRLEAEGTAVSNPVSILRWNSDKSYLAELNAAGISSVPTLVSDALDADAQNPLIAARADGIGPAQFFAVKGAAEGQILALGEIEQGAIFIARGECHHHRIARFAADLGDLQGVEACHFGLLPIRVGRIVRCI